MKVFTSFNTQIEPIKKYEQFGIAIIKGEEKLAINSYKKGLYLDLFSYALAIGITLNQLLEEIV